MLSLFRIRNSFGQRLPKNKLPGLRILPRLKIPTMKGMFLLSGLRMANLTFVITAWIAMPNKDLVIRLSFGREMILANQKLIPIKNYKVRSVDLPMFSKNLG